MRIYFVLKILADTAIGDNNRGPISRNFDITPIGLSHILETASIGLYTA